MSESEEREISGNGSLSDKVVLMSFWFTVFVLVVAVIVVFQRSKKGKRRGGDLSSSVNYFNSSSSLGGDEGDSSALLVNGSNSSTFKNGKSSTSSWRHPTNNSNNFRYTPVNLNDGGECYEEDDEDDEEEYYNQQFSQDYPNHNANAQRKVVNKSHDYPQSQRNPQNSRKSMLAGTTHDEDDDVEFEHILGSQQSEGVPLVLKT